MPISESNVSWQQHFQQLEDYKLTHGDCNNVGCPSLEFSGNPHLGKWLKAQRKIYRAGQLKEERKEKLNGIGLLQGTNEKLWELRFQQLLEYKETEGDCKVLYSSKLPLGKWVYSQRQRYELNQMSKDRKDKLDSIGFFWERGRRRGSRDAYSWDIRFQQLVEYKRTYGDCWVPIHYESNQYLGPWVSTQRSLLKYKKLRNERAAKLESIGFSGVKSDSDRLVHCASKRVDWDFQFQQLVEYKRTHGNCGVPIHYESNPKFGRWVRRQRTLLKSKKLINDRAAKLESIGLRIDSRCHCCSMSLVCLRPPMQPLPFIQSLLHEPGIGDGTSIIHGQAKKSDDWDAFFEELREFVRNHGDSNVPETYHLNPSLVEWVRKQRHDYSLKCGGDKSAMNAEREAKLSLLGFSWEKRESPLVGSNDNNVLYPDEVTSEMERLKNEWRRKS